jgi:hypothetical protein
MEEHHDSVLSEVVRLFVVKEKRARFSELLANRKRRDDGLHQLLNDPRHFDPDCIEEVPSNADSVDALFDRLKRLRFGPTCYVVSSCFREAVERLGTKEALHKICYNTDAMLYCDESKIGYYEGHEGWRYILKRPR